jgi:ATP-dependent protease ClpP protease subunit
MLFKILSQNCGKTFDEIYEISRNDKWFNSDEAKEIGLIDNIVGLETSPSMSQMMEGFDEYYAKEILNKK